MRIIAGKWRSRRLAPVRGRAVRPTTDRVREAWMSIVGERLPGAEVVDLFAGSGALGLEALSRGAARVTFVEKSRGAIRVLERNIRALGAGAVASVVQGDALAHLRALEPLRYDLAFADPPYDRGYAFQLLSAYGRSPFARELWVEHHAKERLPGDVDAEQRRYGDTTLTGVTTDGRRSRRGLESSPGLPGGGF